MRHQPTPKIDVISNGGSHWMEGFYPSCFLLRWELYSPVAPGSADTSVPEPETQRKWKSELFNNSFRNLENIKEAVQICLYFSILLTGLEFNYAVRDLLCPWHWLLTNFNIIRSCAQKCLLLWRTSRFTRIRSFILKFFRSHAKTPTCSIQMIIIIDAKAFSSVKRTIFKNAQSPYWPVEDSA